MLFRKSLSQWPWECPGSQRMTFLSSARSRVELPYDSSSLPTHGGPRSGCREPKHGVSIWKGGVVQRQMRHFVDGVSIDMTASCFSWAPMLANWRHNVFLETQRRFFLQITPQVRVASRTSLRARRGKVHTMWYDGVDFACRSLS